MVYKKYIVKNGKTYGPYIYHSKRVGGKVVSEYHGNKDVSKKNFNFIWVVLAGVFVLALGGYFFVSHQGSVSGEAVLNLDANNFDETSLSGSLDLILKKGEFIPASSKVVFSHGDETFEYSLSDLISEDSSFGNFYVSGSNLSGSGEGYGVEGRREIFSDVNFVLNIYPVSGGSGGSSGGSSGGGSVVDDSDENEFVEDVEIDSTDNDSSGNLEGIEDSDLKNVSSDTKTESGDREVSSDSEGEVDIMEGSEDLESDSSGGSDSGEVALVDDLEEDVENVENSEDSIFSEESDLANENAGEEISSETDSDSDNSESSVSESGSSDSSAKDSDSSESEGSEETPSDEGQGVVITGGVISGIFRKISNSFLALTGNAVSDLGSGEKIEGVVSKDSSFEYDLPSGYSAEIVSSEQDIVLEVKNGVAFVSTDYSEFEEGYGKEFVLNENVGYTMDLSELNFSFGNESFSIDVVFQDETFLSAETSLPEGEINSPEIDLGEDEEISSNESMQDNESLEVEKVFNESLSNESVLNFSVEDLSSELTIEEKALLLTTFGDVKIQTTKSKIVEDRIVVAYLIGNYEAEFSYDAGLDEEFLLEKMEEDRIKWLKDIYSSLVSSDISGEEVKKFKGNFSF